MIFKLIYIISAIFFDISGCVISFIRQIFGFLASMCSVLAIGNAIWEVREGSVFTAFLPREPGVNAALSSFLSFWSYVIVLNTVVPISLYVRYGLRWKDNKIRKLQKLSQQVRRQSSSVFVRPCLSHAYVFICQCGDHPSGEQLLHRLGQEDVLPQE